MTAALWSPVWCHFNELHLQQPYFQIRSHFKVQVLGVRNSTWKSERGITVPITQSCWFQGGQWLRLVMTNGWFILSTWLLSASSLVDARFDKKNLHTSCQLLYIYPYDSIPDLLIFDLLVLFLPGPLLGSLPGNWHLAQQSIYILTLVCFSLYTKQMIKDDPCNSTNWEDFHSLLFFKDSQECDYNAATI